MTFRRRLTALKNRGLFWHRRKLPFEILPIFCQILPHFAIKIAKLCKLSFLFKVYFGPGGPEYLIGLKMHTKMIKNINLISKQEHQSLQREALKFKLHKIFIRNETVIIQEHQSL